MAEFDYHCPQDPPVPSSKTFTEKECTAIMAPILAAGLPTSCICRNFPRALIYGPLKIKASHFPFFTVQGIEHTLIVMEFGYNMKALTGQLLKCNLEALKAEVQFGGTETGTRSRYPCARYGLPEVRCTGNSILDSAYLVVATLQRASH
jgi:hypothetical protein